MTMDEISRKGAWIASRMPGRQAGPSEPPVLASDILDTLREGLLLLDPELRVLAANHSFYQTFQVEEEETLGKVVYELGDGQWDIPALRVLLKETINKEQPFKDYQVEHNFPRIGQKVMLLNARIVEEGAIILAIEDITERHRIEKELQQAMEELQRSNKELESFAYVASHDLQEPLRMVSSYTQLLAKRYQGQLDDEADEFIFFAVDGAKRMQQLINDLLAFSRVGTRGKPFGPVEGGKVLGRALTNLRGAVEESQAEVTTDTMPPLWGDEGQLVQVFQNLLSNAIKFRGPENPAISVAAELRDDEWLFCVRDNGIGIDPQYDTRIFQVFQRLHSRKDYAGTGIGLAICDKIIKRHGGSIWVESELGEGSAFFFTLPSRKE
jgi:signal transduction histidine kinase